MRDPDERKADILDAVRNRDGLVIATGTVAEAADMTPPTARKYLEQLEEEGEVVEEDLAGRMYVWYTPEVLEYGLGAFTGEDPPTPPDDEPEEEEESELRAAGGPPVEQEQPPELMSTVEELEEGMNQLRRDIADLDDDDDNDDDDEEPYADVDSSARRYWLKERDTWQRGITPLGTATTGMLIIAVLVAGLRLPAIPGLGVEPFVVAMGLAITLAGVAGFAAVTAGVITLLLRLRVFTKAGRALPFRADSNGEPRET